MPRTLIVAMLTVLSVGGCAATNDAHRRGTGYPIHVVVCWLKTPGDEVARRRIIDTSRSFDSIPVRG